MIPFFRICFIIQKIYYKTSTNSAYLFPSGYGRGKGHKFEKTSPLIEVQICKICYSYGLWQPYFNMIRFHVMFSCLNLDWINLWSNKQVLEAESSFREILGQIRFDSSQFKFQGIFSSAYYLDSNFSINLIKSIKVCTSKLH